MLPRHLSRAAGPARGRRGTPPCSWRPATASTPLLIAGSYSKLQAGEFSSTQKTVVPRSALHRHTCDCLSADEIKKGGQPWLLRPIRDSEWNCSAYSCPDSSGGL